MVPAFKLIKIPFVLKKILKQSLVDTHQDETGISFELSKDAGLKLLIFQCLSRDFRDRSIQTIYRYYGWDYFRKLIVSIFIHKKLYGQWPIQTKNLFIDKEFSQTEDNFAHFTAKGSFRHTLLALYLRLLELELDAEYPERKAQVISSCLKSLPFMEIKGRKGKEMDLGMLLIWHFTEYFQHDNMTEFLKKGNDYSVIMNELSLSYRKVINTNFMQYLLSIGDYESFGFEKRV